MLSCKGIMDRGMLHKDEAQMEKNSQLGAPFISHLGSFDQQKPQRQEHSWLGYSHPSVLN